LLGAEATKDDLFRACESLFGMDIDVSVEFLKYLKPAGVKAAYRKKALETHPDRAVTLASKANLLENNFKEVNLAYQLLTEFIATPWKYQLDEDGSIRERPHWEKPKQEVKPKEKAKAKYHAEAQQRYRCGVPRRKLRLGQYLYYSGHISLTTLIKAIVWQRLQRPTIGSLAVNWDWLEQRRIIDVLQERHYGEKFGECALRCGYLSKYQLMLLLDRQKILQPQIGKYFIGEGFITADQLDSLIDEMKKHNRNYWSY
jgi:hypothetical protein